jgi:hypothetical protein
MFTCSEHQNNLGMVFGGSCSGTADGGGWMCDFTNNRTRYQKSKKTADTDSSGGLKRVNRRVEKSLL